MIGVFDSGLGGLTIVQHIHQRTPYADICYVADSAYAPYGDRSLAWLKTRSKQIAQFLSDQGALSLVVACNTATAAAVEDLRSNYTFHTVGVEPGVKPALACSQSGKIAVLATPYTIESQRFKQLCERYSSEHHQVYPVPCHGWVSMIEQGEGDPNILAQIVKDTVGQYMELGVDTLVLGCTHFTYLADTIRACFPNAQVIETGEAVAKRVTDIAPLQSQSNKGIVTLFSTGDHARLQVFAQKLGIFIDRCEPLVLPMIEVVE